MHGMKHPLAWIRSKIQGRQGRERLDDEAGHGEGPQFDAGCDWPQRLLHISTMTSYPWTPGDRYGGRYRPKYVALSYTWGRWRLRDHEQPEVRSLPVQGVTWQLPRVRPDHFTAEEFEATLRALPSLLEIRKQAVVDFKYGRVGDAPTHWREPVWRTWLLWQVEKLLDKFRKWFGPPIEFVWVDVACIDQTWGSRNSALEIGRQAKIFRGALCTFSWLTTYEDTVSEDFSRISRSFRSKLRQAVPEELSVFVSQTIDEEVSDYIESFSTDHWFSSLWTLQEAFICWNMIFLARNAKPWLRETSDGPFVNLHDLLKYLDSLRTSLQQNLPSNATHNQFPLVQSALERSGLIGLYDHEPTALLSLAQYRQTTDELDRVYGIMQVFDFRLGKSQPGVDPKKDFTLSELEDELGQALMESQPVRSQLHVFTQPPEQSKGWRIARTSRLASNLNKSAYDHLGRPGHNVTSCAKLSTALIAGRRWGTFSGRLCRLHDLNTGFSARQEVEPLARAFTVDLDLIPPYPVNNFHLSNTLLRDRADAHILLLGLCRRSKMQSGPFNKSAKYSMPGTPCHGTGLVLVPFTSSGQQRVGYWARIGICLWWISRDSDGPSDKLAQEHISLLSGESAAWANVSGIFG